MSSDVVSPSQRITSSIFEPLKGRCYKGGMTTILASVTDLSDTQLLDEVRTLARDERYATAHLIACLVEVDARRLYLGEGRSSLFVYCTEVLHLSEHAAYGRIEAARAAKRFPAILDRLAEGSITLTTVCLLGPHLTVDNHKALLDSAHHKSRREVEHIVARIQPSPPIESSVRKLPARRTMVGAAAHVLSLPCAPQVEQPPITSSRPSSSSSPAAPKRPAIVAPIAPEQYKIQMTVSRDTYEKLRRAQELIRHAIPNADPAAIFDRALTLLVAELEKAKFAATTRPHAARETAAGSRHIPAAVKREVWTRDDGRCAFVGTRGRCTERGFLEFHHRVPYADGGQTSIENLELRCRAHNAYEAERRFGPLLLPADVADADSGMP
jgi:hypothetical protein